MRVRWSGKRQLVGWGKAGARRGHGRCARLRWRGHRPQAVEVLLYGLGGCTAMDVVSVLEKKRLDLRGFSRLCS